MANETASDCVELPFWEVVPALCGVLVATLIAALYYRHRWLVIINDPRNTLLDKYKKRTKGSVVPKAKISKSKSLTPSSPKGTERDGKNKSSKHPWEINFKELKLKENIGAGNFGDVFRGFWLGSEVAVKIPKAKIPKELLDRFLEEIDLMTTLHHPNIVIFMAACVKPPTVCLVLEYLSHGSMYDYLRDGSKKMHFSMLHKFATDIARGMKYLHRRCGIIQRDLKSRNLLIDDAMNVKICDFGLSRYGSNDETMTHCGTPYWTAPEVIRQEDYDEKADVYSFSICLWELITRDEPYDGMPGMEVAFAAAEKNLRPKIPPFCPEEYKVMMVECWDNDPKKRPSFDELLVRLFAIGKEAAKGAHLGTKDQHVAHAQLFADSPDGESSSSATMSGGGAAAADEPGSPGHQRLSFLSSHARSQSHSTGDFAEDPTLEELKHADDPTLEQLKLASTHLSEGDRRSLVSELQGTFNGSLPSFEPQRGEGDATVAAATAAAAAGDNDGDGGGATAKSKEGCRVLLPEA